MGKEQRLTFSLNGDPIFEIINVLIKNGNLMKPVIGDSNTHYHLYKIPEGFGHTVTTERKDQNSTSTHTPSEKTQSILLNQAMIAGFCPDGEVPPEISSLNDAEEVKKLTDWLLKVLPRIVHRPEHNETKRPKGEVMTRILKIISDASNGKDVTIDMVNDLMKIGESIDDGWETIFEDEMSNPDNNYGYSMDESKIIYLLDDGGVIEFNLKLSREYYDRLFDSLGVDSYLSTALTNEAITEKLKKLMGESKDRPE